MGTVICVEAIVSQSDDERGILSCLIAWFCVFIS